MSVAVYNLKATLEECRHPGRRQTLNIFPVFVCKQVHYIMWYVILVITGHYGSKSKFKSILPEVYAPKVMTAMVALVSK